MSTTGTVPAEKAHDPRAPRPLTAAEVADLAVADPRDRRDVGRLQYARQVRCANASEAADVRAAIAARLAETGERYDVPPRHEWTAHAPDATVKARSRDLTPAEVAWLGTLPTDPAKLDAADAQRLDRLTREARSEVDRHLAASILTPAREHHRARAELVDAERALALAAATDPRRPAPITGWPTAPDWSTWRDAIAARVRAEVPELTEAEARLRADTMVAERIEARQAERAHARARLGDVVRRTGLASERYPQAVNW